MNHRRRLAIKDRSEKIIEGHGLTKIYGTGDVSTIALNKVTFDIRRGEFVLIVGQSGSGKSTLLHIIGLLDKPTAGKIVIDGIDATYLSDSDRSLVRRYKIGFIFQAYNLLSDLTVEENVMLQLMMVNKGSSSAMRRKVEMVLEKVGLARQNKQSKQLS